MSTATTGFDHLGIATVLSRKRLQVPVNQREYAWEEEHVNALFEDISDAIREDRPDYFLGTVVVVDRGDHLEVVDGQQRLATTSILLSAFRDYFIETDDSIMVEAIDNNHLTVIDRNAGERVPKILLNTEDRHYFKERVVARPKERPKVNPTVKSHERINTACEAAAKFVQKIVGSLAETNRRNALNDWITYLEEKAKVVLLIAPSRSDAFIMFETLNDRGLEASQADLVKNHLFSKAADRLPEAQNLWKAVVTTIEAMDLKNGLMEYLRHYCCVRSGATRDYQILQKIESMVKTKTQAIEFLISLAEYSTDYAAIFNSEHSKWNPYEENVRNSIDILRLLGAQKMRPLMLAVSHCFDKPQAATTMRMLVNWAVRFLVVGGGEGGVMDKQFSLWAKKVNDGEVHKRSELALLGKGFIPGDGTFQRAFEGMQSRTAKITRYYLRCLERTKRQDAEPSLASEDDKTINLEHVLPLNPRPTWKHINKDIAADLARRLGNMVLLRQQENKQIGTEDFEAKKSVFKDSTHLLTRDVASVLIWSEQEIVKRQADLAKLAVETWPSEKASAG